ncbi:hypothetical protein EVAR_97295_1 [Eumeta japonica]|uniref:Uncharacterized protein n=1 Tax=Eumeta variegata TaxID=151549 RepID=A0A4C1XF98_EUMVA|nr:hypothetical protein EVAR_97295_1 [Eumeta japonica]
MVDNGATSSLRQPDDDDREKGGRDDSAVALVVSTLLRMRNPTLRPQSGDSCLLRVSALGHLLKKNSA